MTTENKRNLAEDLAICEAARVGMTGPAHYMRSVHSEYSYEICRPDFIDTIIASVIAEEDAHFIAEAFEGWPEAIRRAVAAEAEVASLKKDKRLITACYDGQSARASDYYREMVQLREALERISAATMSQYASTDDMIRELKRIAKEALHNATQENNG